MKVVGGKALPKRTHYKPGQKLGSSQQDRVQAKLWKDIRDKILADKEKLAALPADMKILLGDEKSFQPKDYERLAKIAEKLQKMTPEDLQFYRMLFDRDIIRPAKPGEEPEIEDPAEIVRLYQVLQSKVQDFQIGEKGAQGWLRFSRFLDANKDKIEGILYTSPQGKLTQEKIEKIIAEYGKYISAEPVETEEKKTDQPEKLETLEDFEKQFKYDPGWQKLSKEDRKLLLDYAKLAPDQITDEKVNFTRVNTTMKLAMALKLANGWPGEIAEAAKAASVTLPLSSPWF